MPWVYPSSPAMASPDEFTVNFFKDSLSSPDYYVMSNLMAVFHMFFSMLMCGEREKPSSDFEAHTYFSRYARWALREFLSEAESAVEQVGEVERMTDFVKFHIFNSKNCQTV